MFLVRALPIDRSVGPSRASSHRSWLALTAVVFAVALLVPAPVGAVTEPGNSTLVAHPGPAGRIVYEVGRNGQNGKDIWIRNPDGFGARNLTASNGLNDWAPAWCGDQVIFRRQVPGGDDIYLVHPDTLALTAVTLTAGQAGKLDPSCDPAGTVAVFIQGNPASSSYDVALKQIGSDPAAPATFLTATAGVNEHYPVLSPDGTRVAFQSDVGGDCANSPGQVWVMPVSGIGSNYGLAGRLTHGGFWNVESPGGWSPDGTKLAYHRHRWDGKNSEIVVINADGSNPDVRYDAKDSNGNSVNNSFPVFSPDGSTIVFHRMNPWPESQLYTVSATGPTGTGAGPLPGNHWPSNVLADWGPHAPASPRPTLMPALGLGTPCVYPVVASDTTPPMITASVSGTLGDNGWYVSDVSVDWEVSEPESVATPADCDSVTVEADTAGTDLECSSSSAGGSATATVSVKRDATAPTVAFTGQQASYALTDTVAIACEASDAMSGVASDTCADISGAAWSFGAGTTTVTATATDNAGNVGSGSVSFEVVVDASGLCALGHEFSSKADVARSLCAKLDAFAASVARGNARSAAGQLGAYRNHVKAQAGKAFTQAEADLLLEFSTHLG